MLVPLMIALAIGIASPLQTGVNTKLREHLGSPFLSALVSFAVGTTFLYISFFLTKAEPHIFESEIVWWSWLGGCLGVIFLTGNILLMPKLGSVQTAIYPVVGQMMMGLMIDHFGWFQAERVSLTILRTAGGIIVILGAVTITLSREHQEDRVKSADRNRVLWLWRLFGIGAGMASSAQTAVNGHLGRILNSPLEASVVSFTIGTLTLLLLNVLFKTRKSQSGLVSKGPWWMWFGGLLGVVQVLGNIILSGMLGVGMTVTANIVGISLGSASVDHYGLAGSVRKPVTAGMIVGLLIMIAGAAMIKII